MTATNEKTLFDTAKNLFNILNPSIPQDMQFKILLSILNQTQMSTSDVRLIELSGIMNAMKILSGTNALVQDLQLNETEVLQKRQVQIMGNLIVLMRLQEHKYTVEYRQMKQYFESLQSKMLEGLCPEVGNFQAALYVTTNLDIYLKRAEKQGPGFSVGSTIDERIVFDEDKIVD